MLNNNNGYPDASHSLVDDSCSHNQCESHILSEIMNELPSQFTHES